MLRPIPKPFQPPPTLTNTTPQQEQQKKGKYTRLVGRHANYTSIGHSAAERWVHHMTLAMEDHEILRNDDEAKQALKKYFQYTAHYIVVASEYMRPDQVRQEYNHRNYTGSESRISHAFLFLSFTLLFLFS